jgi:hypothetical protein
VKTDGFRLATVLPQGSRSCARSAWANWPRRLSCGAAPRAPGAGKELTGRALAATLPTRDRQLQPAALCTRAAAAASPRHMPSYAPGLALGLHDSRGIATMCSYEHRRACCGCSAGSFRPGSRRANCDRRTRRTEHGRRTRHLTSVSWCLAALAHRPLTVGARKPSALSRFLPRVSPAGTTPSWSAPCGRSETEDGRVVAVIREYDDRATYDRIQAAVRSDPDSVRASQYRASLPSLITAREETFMTSTVPARGSGPL